MRRKVLKELKELNKKSLWMGLSMFSHHEEGAKGTFLEKLNKISLTIPKVLLKVKVKSV